MRSITSRSTSRHGHFRTKCEPTGTHSAPCEPKRPGVMGHPGRRRVLMFCVSNKSQRMSSSQSRVRVEAKRSVQREQLSTVWDNPGSRNTMCPQLTACDFAVTGAEHMCSSHASPTVTASQADDGHSHTSCRLWNPEPNANVCRSPAYPSFQEPRTRTFASARHNFPRITFLCSPASSPFETGHCHSPKVPPP